MDLLLQPFTLGVLVHGLVVLGVGARVVMMRPLPSVALAWLLLVSALPLLGLFGYLAFGERRIGGRRAGRLARLREPYEAYLRELLRLPTANVPWEGLPDAARGMNHLGVVTTGFPTLVGNDLELLVDAPSVVRAILSDVEQARESVHLQFYIWHPGGLADEVAGAVERAAQRGVACRVLVDALGSAVWLRSEWPGRLRRAGATVIAALPAGFLRMLFRRNDLRNHRKIAVVDGEVAYTGSMNMVDPRFFKRSAGVGQWIDAMVRVRGPAVTALLGVFLADWFLETRGEMAQVVEGSGLRPRPPAGGAAVQVLPSGPAFGSDAILQMLLLLLYAARRRILITTPYFVPDEAMLRALRSAGARGVEVVLIVPEKVDSLLVRYASRSYYDDLMEVGVRIHCHRGGLLHTKSVVVDEHIAMFGTHNLDMRSLWLNFEVSLFVYDQAFGAVLHALQASYLESCVAIDRTSWRARPWPRRLVENVARLCGPML
jgi:cardiolipin synthase